MPDITHGDLYDQIEKLDAENVRLRAELAECEDVLRFTEEEAAKRGDQLDRLAAVLGDVDAAVAALPQEERDEHARAQQSVIDARRSANAIEGHIVIGGTSPKAVAAPLINFQTQPEGS